MTTDLHWAHPHVAWLALVALALVGGLWAYDRARRAQLVRRLGEWPVLGRVMASASPGRRLTKAVLAGAGLALVVLGLARPQLAGTRRVELRGLDLVVAMDVSKSMMVDDVEATSDMTARRDVSRLARARELATAVIDELPGDRVAPVVFAGAAARFPLTEDHVVAAQFLSDLGPADLPPGSNLAEVFRVARCLLRPDLYADLGCARLGRRGHGGDPLPGESLDPAPRPGAPAAPVEDQRAARGKAIAIFTDGGDASPEALREVALARELGIAVLIVGVGTRAGGVVYEVDSAGRRTNRPKRGPGDTTITSRRDDDGMRALAAAAGDADRYLIANEHGEVDPMPIVEALRRVDRGLSTKQVPDLREVDQPVMFAGLLLLLIEVAISTRRRRAHPEALS